MKRSRPTAGALVDVLALEYNHDEMMERASPRPKFLVERVLGASATAARYEGCAARLKASFNRDTRDGGFWDADKQWYIYWREKDGSCHGSCLVTPINFMAIAYGLCDDPARREAILRQIEERMNAEL